MTQKRRLILLRHGEAESGFANDHGRALTPMGERQAVAIGRQLSDMGWIPHRAAVSTAKRAQQTWKFARQAFTNSIDEMSDDALYLGQLLAVRMNLETSGNDIECVIAVGHNPGWSAAISLLAEEPGSLSPANAALFEVEADSWTEAFAMAPAWNLIQILTPQV